MTAKLLNLFNNYAKWLLATGLLLVLVLGFLQIPEVGSRLFPNFLWQDFFYQLQKESRKVEWQLSRVNANIASLQNGGRANPLKMRQIKKDIVSITRSLRFMDARLASMTLDLKTKLLQAPLDQRSGLHACLAEIKTLQLGWGEYRHNLQEASQKVQYFQARLDY